jgi:hypothetical protein
MFIANKAIIKIKAPIGAQVLSPINGLEFPYLTLVYKHFVPPGLCQHASLAINEICPAPI